MPIGKTSEKPPKRPTEPYVHKGKKRINNPPVGLVTPETDPPLPTPKVYDPHEPVPSVKPGKNRRHGAVKSGFYALVRHPEYSSATDSESVNLSRLPEVAFRFENPLAKMVLHAYDPI
jgi:hypothetical protein